jgi:hypothetical protein
LTEGNLLVCGAGGMFDLRPLTNSIGNRRVLAVPSNAYLASPEKPFRMLRNGGILINIKSAIDPASVPSNLRYWSL